MAPGLIDAGNMCPAKDVRFLLRTSGYTQDNIADMSWLPVGRRGTRSASRRSRKTNNTWGGGRDAASLPAKVNGLDILW
jgi:hypothetical protein